MIYHVYANRSNIGDWLSALGIQKLLQPLPVTECLCDGPFVEDAMKTLASAGEDDLIIIGGGGLLMDYFLPFWEQFSKIAPRVRFCVWGIGCCDLKQESTKAPLELLEGILGLSRYTVLRDNLSAQYLKNIPVSAVNACPSINFIERVPLEFQGVLHVANYTTVGPEAYDTMREVSQSYSAAADWTFRETDNRIQKDSRQQLAERLERYRKSHLIVSSGLHGCIIGVAMGRKVLAVSGDHKIDEFMRAVDLEGWVIDASQVGRFAERLDDLGSQPEGTGKLGAIRQANCQIAEEIRRLVKN